MSTKTILDTCLVLIRAACNLVSKLYVAIIHRLVFIFVEFDKNIFIILHKYLQQTMYHIYAYVFVFSASLYVIFKLLMGPTETSVLVARVTYLFDLLMTVVFTPFKKRTR